MARRIWGRTDAVGREIRVSPIGNFRVIGIVGDVRNLQLAQEPNPTMYISTARYLWPAMTVLARARTENAQLSSVIRSVVRELDPQLAVYNTATTRDQIRNSVAQPRLNASLVGAFALTACLLAAIGLYGVLAYLVSQRRQEIGIRMALGAARRSVLGLFLRRGLRVTIPGACIGVLGAMAAARWIESIVFGVSARDPWTIACAAALVTSVAMLASYIPARRATEIDPLTALRTE
jgi:ABC-type antimicrobial peptide transport system permease subunit